MKFEVPVTDEQIVRWKAGELIQRVMPELTPDQRELLISQTCGDCFDDMFKYDNDTMFDEEPDA